MLLLLLFIMTTRIGLWEPNNLCVNNWFMGLAGSYKFNNMSIEQLIRLFADSCESNIGEKNLDLFYSFMTPTLVWLL